MRLQRSAGNAAVSSLFRPVPVQRERDGGAAGAAVAEPPATEAPEQRRPLSEPSMAPAPPPPPSGPPAAAPPPPPFAGPSAPGPPEPPAQTLFDRDSATPPAPSHSPAAPARDQTPVELFPGLAPPAVPQVTGAAAEEFAAFAARVADLRASLLQSARTTKQRIRVAADLQKTNVQGAAATDGIRVDEGYLAAINRVQQAATESRSQIVARRDADIGTVQAAAEKKLTELDKTIADQQAALKAAGEDKAVAANQVGEDQGTRAIAESRRQGAQAIDVGSTKGAEWTSHSRGEEIARVAGEMASDLAQQLVKNGEAMAAQARRDASSLAAKFRKEAEDSASKFGSGRAEAAAKITSVRDAAIQKITGLAKEPLARLEQQAGGLAVQLQIQRADAGQQFRKQVAAATDSVETAAGTALKSVDEKTAESTSALDGVVPTLATKLKAASKPHVKRALDRASRDLGTEISGFDGEMGKFAAQTVQTLESGAAQMARSLGDQVAVILAPAIDTAEKLASTATSTTGSTTDEIGKATTEAQTAMDEVVHTTAGELTKAVDQSRSQWAQDLAAGTEEIRGKVDKGLAEGAKELAGLPSAIDKKGQEIENESWLSRAWEFTKGFLAGFFKSLGKLILVLLVVALAVIVILAVVLVVAALIGGLGAVFAVIGAIAAVIATIAALPGAVLVGIAIAIGAIIVLVALYKIYKALTEGKLHDYERGELWGSAIFDILTVIFGAKIVKSIAEWIEAARGGEEIAQLAELRAMVQDEQLLQRLLKLAKNDGAELKSLLQLLNKDGVMAEKLLILTGNDVAKAKGLLGLCGNDGALLEKLLVATGDAEKAAKILTLCGKNPAVAREMMQLAEDNPQRILDLFEKNGGDAGKVLDELREAKAVAEMINDLEKVGIPRAYLDKLKPGELKDLKGALEKWNLDAAGKNQGFTHTVEYSEGAGGAAKTNRLTSLADYTGKGPFDPNDPNVIRDVTRALDDLTAAAKANPQQAVDLGGSKFKYFYPKGGAAPPFSNSAKGIVIIEFGGKYSSFFNTSFGGFVKLK